jgi:hypothetical protein
MRVLWTALAALWLLAGGVRAATERDLWFAGYVELWRGEAALMRCMDRRDGLWLDRYRFDCSIRPYGPVFLTGPARLLARRVDGVAGVSAWLCFESRPACVEGSLSRRD